jgi:hypothetical protein
MKSGGTCLTRQELIRTIADLKFVIQEIYWMARRYASGRQTYAPSMYNDAIRLALKHGVLLSEDMTEFPPTYYAHVPENE